MAKKTPTKRPRATKAPSELETRQAELDRVRKLKKINRGIVAEGKAVGRLLERGNVVLGRVLADYLERAGMVALDGAAHARILDSRTDLGHRLDLANDEITLLRELLNEHASPRV